MNKYAIYVFIGLFMQIYRYANMQKLKYAQYANNVCTKYVLR